MKNNIHIEKEEIKEGEYDINKIAIEELKKEEEINNSKNINNDSQVLNNQINQIINPGNIEDIDITSDDFLEKSLINEIKQTINQLEHHCETQIGESAVEDRCRILSYAIILVDVYKKSVSNLIYPHAKLGEAYYDIKYYEQAKEHIENAFKYNNDTNNEKYQKLPEDYFLRLAIKLSKCNLELKQYETALKIANKSLENNKNFFGENDISNVEIYDIIYQAEKNLEKIPEAIEHLKILYEFYSKIYDEKSDKCCNALKEIASLYEIEKQYKEAIEYYFKYFDKIEEIEIKNKMKEIYDTAMKIAGLYAELKQYKEAYDFLKKIDNEYNNGYNKTDKEKCEYQNFLCTLAFNLNDDNIYLNELIVFENILVQCKKIDPNMLGKTYLNIGDIYKKQNEFDKSIEYYKKAMNIFKKNSDGNLLIEINKLIKEVEKEKRNYEINKI
jgi:tetratricopeptide (TPR) repeat protein